jgi:F-type H+-transporting ATPase subunit b
MELDLSTLIMEAINFLILVWIMNRILYRPVAAIIAQRQAALEQTRAEAAQLRSEAVGLRQTYQVRLASWDTEKAELRRQLHAEIAVERQRLMAALDEELAGMRDKARVAEERRSEELVRLSEERAIAHAGRFAARLLARTATAEQGMLLMGMLLEDLAALPDDQRRAIDEALGKDDAPVQVISAHPLAPTASQAFEGRFREMFPEALRFSFTEDPSLLAGVRVIAGPWNLAANLSDELAFFRGGTDAD